VTARRRITRTTPPEHRTLPAGDSTSVELEAEAGRAALESMLTEVEEDSARDEAAVADSGLEQTDKEAKLAPAPDKPAAAPVAVASVIRKTQTSPAPPAVGRGGRGIWMLAALFVLNTIAILILARGLASFRTNQQNHFDQLIGVLREDLQARRATTTKQGTDDILAHVEEAGRLFDSAQYGLALPLLQKVSKALPGRHDLLWKVAVSNMHLKRWHKAVEALREFTERFPDTEEFPRALMRMGECYKQLGLHGRARKMYYRLLGLSGRLSDEQQPLIPAAYDAIADCYRLEASLIQAGKTDPRGELR